MAAMARPFRHTIYRKTSKLLKLISQKTFDLNDIKFGRVVKKMAFSLSLKSLELLLLICITLLLMTSYEIKQLKGSLASSEKLDFRRIHSNVVIFGNSPSIAKKGKKTDLYQSESCKISLVHRVIPYYNNIPSE